MSGRPRPPPRSRSFDGQFNRAPPPRSGSFERRPPPRSGSFDRAPPPRSRSFDRVPPPRTSSFDRAPPPRSRSFDRVPPPRTSSFDRAPPQRGRSFDRAPPQRSGSFDRAPPGHRARSRSFDRIPPSRTNSFDRQRPPGPPQRRPSMDKLGVPPGGRGGGGGDNYMGRSFRRIGGRGITSARQRIGEYREKEGCTMCKCLGYLTPITLLLASSGGLVYFSGNAGTLKDLAEKAYNKLVPELKNEDLVDSYAGGNSIAKWNNQGGNGLELTFVNALEPKWNQYFTIALADWDFGNPDSLTLSSESADYDYDCEAVDGVVKVCNGDYGETNWRGLNQAVADGSNYVTSSAAKMNEFYLQNESNGAKQYTMCHELGHALGLPHSDEDFNNEDLGNCMDYTNNFDENKHPDESQFEILLDYYGAIGLRRYLKGKTRYKAGFSKTPEHIRQKVKQVVQKLERRNDGKEHEDGWKLLHRNHRGEEHEMQLGEGYKVRVHKLLA